MRLYSLVPRQDAHEAYYRAARAVMAHRLTIREEIRVQEHMHISLEGGALHSMHGDCKPARATGLRSACADAHP